MTANEIQFSSDSGDTCYVNITNTSGQWYNTVSESFESFLTLNFVNYDIAATEFGTSGVFAATMPALATGVYNVLARRRAGGSPAQSDSIVGEGEIVWSGSAVISIATQAAQPGQGTPAANENMLVMLQYLFKAFRNKSTQDSSTYKLYGDDGSTVHQKATTSDSGTEFAREEITTGP